MEIELLREFITLSQTLNYTKAAQKLHLTQPTLSKHIVSVEKELGCQLFSRDRRKVELTEAGTLFAAAAIQMVDTYDEAQLRISELQHLDPIKVNGQLFDTNVSAIISVASSLIDAGQHASIVYEDPAEGDFLERLLQDEIDIALSFVDPNKAEELGLAYAPLSRAQFAAVVSIENPLSRMTSLSIDEMRNCRFIRFVDKYANLGWLNIEIVCREHGFTPRTRTVLGRNRMNYTAVSLGPEEVCILESSKPQLQYLPALSRVVVIPVVDDDATFKLFAIYKKDNYERVKFALDAYAKARKIVMSSKGNGLLVEAE